MKLIIPGSLTDLNTYINAERTNRFIASKIKKQETNRIYAHCLEQRLKPFKGNITTIVFRWICKNKKKDKDNIVFAKKFVLDGLKLAGVIKNDGWNDYDGFIDTFEIDEKNPRVEVEVL